MQRAVIMGTVVLSKLIKRCPENETEYDKNMNMEYWQYQWSDGSFGQGSLYQTQIKGLEIMATENRVASTCPIDDRYWVLRRLADKMGALPVSNFYYAVMQFPSAAAKQKVIDAAKRLGLKDLSGQGTIRLAYKYGKKSFDRIEVYIHTQQEPANYGITNQLLTMDLYRGSELEPSPMIDRR